MTISLFKRKSAVAKMLSVLKSFGANAHLYLPGVGVISGVTAGNYLDSGGATPASVDGLVGLDLDAAGSVGSELVTTPSIAAVGIGGPVFTNYSTGAIVVSGKTYKISYTVSGYSGSGNVGFAGTVFNGHSAATANGTYVNMMVATGTGAVEMFSRSTNTCQFSGITVKEITGIHATQATTGNKPTLRRGIVNLLTYSNDLSNAAWDNWLLSSTDSYTRTAPDGSASAVEFTTSGTGGKYNRPATVVAGITYTSAAWMKKVAGDLRLVVASQAAYGGTGGDRYVEVNGDTGAFISKHADVSSYSIYSGGNGWYLIAGTFTPTSSATSPMAVYTQTAGTIQAWRAGRFQGTPTAQQIQAAGGIPVTTTAPASSNVGAYAWEFDGAGDSLVLNSLPFTLSDDHCVIAAGRANDSADSRTFFTNSGTDITRVCQVYIANATGYPTVLWRDSANSANGSCVDAVNRVGQFIVISGRKVGNQLECAVNGAVKESKIAVLGASTPVAAAIGANTAMDGYYHKGDLGGVIAIKGTVTPADTLTLSRGLNALSGYAAGVF